MRKGSEEYFLCWRLEDCRQAGGSPTPLPLHDPTAALYFLRSFITDSGLEHELRLWLLTQNSSFPMYLTDDDDILDRTALMIASGQLVVASMDEGGGAKPQTEGILRKGGGQGKSVLLSHIETTPLQDEMASRQVAAAEAASAEEETAPEEPAVPETTWIEIELFDPNGKPVPNERYKITMPDGSIKYGRLDNNAKARIEKLQPGSCRVTFPDRDQEVWDVG